MNNRIAHRRNNLGSRQDRATPESQITLVLYKEDEDEKTSFIFRNFRLKL